MVGDVELKLYDMLKASVYFAECRIYLTNCYDQNMPLFDGFVEDARHDEDVWDYLMCEVEVFDTTKGVLLIKVRNDWYEDRFEKLYVFSDRWKEDKEHRPWRSSAEIDTDITGRRKEGNR